jgi:hypothetical protein
MAKILAVMALGGGGGVQAQLHPGARRTRRSLISRRRRRCHPVLHAGSAATDRACRVSEARRRPRRRRLRRLSGPCLGAFTVAVARCGPDFRGAVDAVGTGVGRRAAPTDAAPAPAPSDAPAAAPSP